MSALPVEALLQRAPVLEAPPLAAAAAAALPHPAGNSRIEQLAWRHARLRLHHPGLIQPGESPDSTADTQARRWSFANLEGRLVELSGDAASASLTLAVQLTAQAQAAGDLAAWVCGPEGGFYPPDLVPHGIDLAQLAVIRAPSAERVALAAIRLLHSGGFGLVVLDLAQPDGTLLTAPSPKPRPGRERTPRGGGISDAHLGRLAQQAQKHQAAVVCLTRKPAQRESLGSLVSVRAESGVRRVAADRFCCSVNVLKDKRHGAGWHHEEVFGGPPGLH